MSYKNVVIAEMLTGVAVLTVGMATVALAQEDLLIGGGVTVVGQRVNDATLATNGGFRATPPAVDDDKANGASLTYTVDVEMEKPFEFGTGYIRFTAAEGDPVFHGSNGYGLGSFFGQNLGVAEAWYALSVFDGVFTFGIGKINPGRIYDRNEVANDASSQFLADVLVSNAAFLSPGPQSGMNFSLNFELVTLDLGFFQDIGALLPLEPVPGEMEYTFIAGEVGLHYDLFENPGNLRVGFFSSGANDRSGFLMNMDQAFFDEIFSLFWRLGLVSGFDDTGPAAVVETSAAFSAGAQVVMFGVHRIGIAFSIESPSLETFEVDNEIFDYAARRWFEIYVDFEIEEGVNFALDLQTAASMDFTEQQDTAVIFGFRFQTSLY